MPHARFKLTEADIVEAAARHKAIAAARNPMMSRLGGAITAGLTCIVL